MEMKKKDELRDKRLNQLGVAVLRFDDMDIKYKLDKVLEIIEKWIDKNSGL